MHSLLLTTMMMGALSWVVHDHPKALTIDTWEGRHNTLEMTSSKYVEYGFFVQFKNTQGETVVQKGVLHLTQKDFATTACIETLKQACQSLQDFHLFVEEEDLLSALLADQTIEWQDNSFQKIAIEGKDTKISAKGFLTIRGGHPHNLPTVNLSYGDWAFNPEIGYVMPQQITGTVSQTRFPYELYFEASLQRLVFEK